MHLEDFIFSLYFEIKESILVMLKVLYVLKEVVQNISGCKTKKKGIPATWMQSSSV